MLGYHDDSIRKRYISREEIDKLPHYRIKLDVVETKTYNLDGTWAHTRPDERVIVMLPPEFRDYSLPIFPHEVIHNWRPSWSEAMVRRAAYNKTLAQQAVQSFDYNFRRA